MTNNGLNDAGTQGESDPPTPADSDVYWPSMPVHEDVPNDWLVEDRISFRDLRLVCRLPEISSDLRAILWAIRDYTHPHFHCTWLERLVLAKAAGGLNRQEWYDAYHAGRDELGLIEEEERRGKETLRRVVIPEELLERAEDLHHRDLRRALEKSPSDDETPVKYDKGPPGETPVRYDKGPRETPVKYDKGPPVDPSQGPIKEGNTRGEPRTQGNDEMRGTCGETGDSGPATSGEPEEDMTPEESEEGNLGEEVETSSGEEDRAAASAERENGHHDPGPVEEVEPHRFLGEFDPPKPKWRKKQEGGVG